MDIREFYPNFAFMNTGQKLALLDRNKKEKNIMENVVSFTISKREVYTLNQVAKIVQPLIDNNIDFYTVTWSDRVELLIPTTPNVPDSFNSIAISRLYLLGVRETFYCSDQLANWTMDNVNYFSQQEIDLASKSVCNEEDGGVLKKKIADVVLKPDEIKSLTLTFDGIRKHEALHIIELLAGSNYIPSFQSWDPTEN